MIGQALLQQAVFGGQYTFIPIRVGRQLHFHSAVHHLAIGRRIDQGHGRVDRQTINTGPDHGLLPAKHLGRARFDFVDRGARGGLEFGPGHHHAPRGLERIFWREQRIKRAQQHHASQHIANADQFAPVHGAVDRHLRQTRGGLFFDGFINSLRQSMAAGAKHQQVDQRVFHFRLATLDRFRGIDRIDAANHQRQNPPHEEIEARAHAAHEQDQSSPKTQPAANHPVIDERGEKEIEEHARQQSQDIGDDIDAAYVAARLAQLSVDVRFVFDQRAAGWRRGLVVLFVMDRSRGHLSPASN